MVSSGIRQIKVDIPWREIQPRKPINGNPRYEWASTDRMMEAMAEAGAKPNVTISLTPEWAATKDPLEVLQCGDPGIRTLRPLDEYINDYVAAAAAIAQRYGRGGSFWEGKERSAVIQRYFIWNEASILPNWCPLPDPEAYAQMLGKSALAIKARDPKAYVLNGGIPDTAPHQPPQYQQPGDFLGTMLQARPSLLSEIDAIGINTFWLNPNERPLDRLVWFREELRRGGVPDFVPMLVAEIGWATSGRVGIPEAERSERMRRYTRAVPRTNCNVSGVSAHTWVSQEVDSSNSQHWFGIADPLTAELYPAAIRYTRSIAIFRGQTKKKAPRRTIFNCEGMPAPDRDYDGVPDEADNAPLNPRRT